MNLEEVKKLRERTSLSIALCKKALEEARGNFDEALKILDKKSIGSAEKKGIRETKSGVIDSYIHSNKKLGVLIELRSETDFVARNEAFQKLAHDLAMHIAASNPSFIKKELIPDDIKAEIRKVYEEEIAAMDKPKEVKDKILEGKLKSHLDEITLYEQPFIKDQDKKIKEIIEEAILKFGENIEIVKFSRFQL